MMQTVAAHSSLECAICFEEYKKVTPRLLSCGHTFCELCLTSLSRKGSLQCPSCRATESLNGGKVFQKNYALEELVQSMFASLTKSKPKSHLDDYDRKQNSKLCDNCSRQAAVLICHDCGGIVYCRGCCLSVHDAMPAVMKRCGSRRTHEPLPFCDELFQCPEHPTAFCIAFCETDRTPICHECIRIGGHASHSHSSLKSSSLRQRTLLDVQLETIRREFNQIKEGREANPKKISEAQAVLMTKTEKIASTFSTLQRLLSAQEEALKAELNAQSLLLTSRLEADNSRIDTAFDTIQQMLTKVAEKMQQSGSSPALDMTFLKSGSFEAQTLLDSVSAQLSTLKSLHAESEGDEKQLPLQSALNSLDDITRSLSDQIKTITLSPTGSFTMRSLAPSAPVSGYIPPAPPVMGAYKKPVVQQQPDEDDEADMGFSLFD